MPLKLVPPRAGKSPNYTIRGTYLKVRVDRTSGTPDKAVATKELKRLKRLIEGGRFDTEERQVTFASAALSYIRAGGETLFLEKLTDHFEDTPLPDIGQPEIDEAAALIYPDASPATRNRQVYTPMSAILKHAGVEFSLKRPKGAAGQVRVDWLWPEQAAALVEAAGTVDAELRALIVILLYCGPRLSEALAIECDGVRLSEAFAFCGTTKNGDPRAMHLPPVVVAELANLGVDRPGERLLRLRKNGMLYLLMEMARSRSKLPMHVTFHTLRHTWATWMRRYAGLDVKGLANTGAWKDEKSASRYAHVVVSEEAVKSDLLPVAFGGKRVE
jgi:integrase